MVVIKVIFALTIYVGILLSIIALVHASEVRDEVNELIKKEKEKPIEVRLTIKGGKDNGRRN